MLGSSLVLIVAGVLGQVEEPKPRLEIAIREPRDLYTDFDEVDIEVFLIADEDFALSVIFCINTDSDLGFPGRFESNPILPINSCVFLKNRGVLEVDITVAASGLLCERVIQINNGRAYLGSLSLRMNPSEEPMPLRVRCGGCVHPTLPNAIVRFPPATDVRLHDAEPLTLTVQRRPFIRGDANLDGSVDISDAITIVHGLFLFGTLACPNAADANDDNAVDISDAVYVAGFLFLGTAPMPPPFPAPGYDPSATSPERTGCTCPIGVHPCL